MAPPPRTGLRGAAALRAAVAASSRPSGSGRSNSSEACDVSLAGRRSCVVASARGGRGRGGGDSSGRGAGQGFSVDRREGAWRVSVNGDSVLEVPEQTLLLSGAVLLGLGAVIGPIIIGLVASAITIGVTLSFGAFALSTMFIPMAIFSMFFFLTFGGMFGGFALLGASLIIPKILSLAVTGAGLAIGWFAVTNFLPKSSATNISSNRGPQSAPAAGATIDVTPEEAEAEAEAERQSRELEDFDKMLAEKERIRRTEQRRRDRML